MKVLTIKEPFASLIKDKKKFIETRSWKTKYRGELYIHAGLSTYKKDDGEKLYLELVKETKINPGKIICKCNLEDCIYMNEEFIADLKQNNYQEYVLGDYKVGRYAWVLTDIKPLENPIEAKGKLNIWNYEEDK